ncbi:MAG TPA: plastocyanin/azurin family copper-binding protein [Balneolaceae bacterium]|nr:plastocyanin/azurin family copper-binding protein [Balneolaceae bacterium]
MKKLSYLFFLTILLTNCAHTPEVHTVEIAQMKFNPPVLYVNKGDTVVFINNGFVDHDVTESENHKWASPVLSAGESWSMVATESSDYYCSIHVVMKGKIVVK